MGTKACIARPDGDTWTGYYVHSDGYPDYTGRVLVEMARALGIEAVLEHAATAPQGWTRFPDDPSIHHNEPFIITPEQHGGIEWLYLLHSDREIAVYRASGWGDPDLRRLTHLATIDPRHSGALADMTALTDVETGVDAVLAGLEAHADFSSAPLGTERLRTWSERVRDMRERATTLEPFGKERAPSVAMPLAGVSMAPDELVKRLVGQRPVSPPCPRWTSWGSLCLVCHRDVPEGQAVAYPFVFGSRACIGVCSEMVSDLLRIYDRSERGRWRPTRDVHTKANGAHCYACMAAAEGGDR